MIPTANQASPRPSTDGNKTPTTTSEAGSSNNTPKRTNSHQGNNTNQKLNHSSPQRCITKHNSLIIANNSTNFKQKSSSKETFV